MPDISLILPTRERPDRALQALASVARTADRPGQLEVVLYVDDDDVVSHGIAHADLRIVKLIRPRGRMGAMTQACYAATTGRLIMLTNDDVLFRTAGWDTAILKTFQSYPDEVALVWGNDLFVGDRLPCLPIMSRKVVELLGRVCPERYFRDYIDTHLYDIFCKLRQLGHHRLVYRPEIIFEHMHIEAGKSSLDNTAVKSHKTDDELGFIAWEEERFLGAARLARHIEATADGN